MYEYSSEGPSFVLYADRMKNTKVLTLLAAGAMVVVIHPSIQAQNATMSNDSDFFANYKNTMRRYQGTTRDITVKYDTRTAKGLTQTPVLLFSIITNDGTTFFLNGKIDQQKSYEWKGKIPANAQFVVHLVNNGNISTGASTITTATKPVTIQITPDSQGRLQLNMAVDGQ